MRLKKGKRPVELTGKGESAVLQGASTYQRLLDIAAGADAHEGIRQGLDQANRGESRDVEEFFAEFEATHGISG